MITGIGKPASQSRTPLISSSNSIEVPDSYIVVFKKHVNHAKAQHHHSWVQSLHEASEGERAELRKRSIVTDIYEGLKHTYNIGDSLMGYSGHFDEDVIEKVRQHPDVSNRPPLHPAYATTLHHASVSATTRNDATLFLRDYLRPFCLT